MRVVTIFRGAPATGKSTFIRENGLEEYTVSLDNLRSLVSGMEPDVDGVETFCIDGKTNCQLRTIFDTVLTARFSNGLTTFIDGTFPTVKSVRGIVDLANKYGYMVRVANFQDGVSLDDALRRNRNRKGVDIVPDKAVERIYRSVESGNKGFSRKFKTVSVSDILDFSSDVIPVINSDGRTVVIGDIQSCSNALSKALDIVRPGDNVIFTGDLFDRGTDPLGVYRQVETLLNDDSLGGVVLIEGNHDNHLRELVLGLVSPDAWVKSGTRESLDKILSGGVTKGGLRRFVHRFVGACFLKSGGREFVLTHGGVSKIPDLLTSFNYLFNGANERDRQYRSLGSYSVETIKKLNLPGDVVQIHGHRNGTREEPTHPVKYSDKHYVLENRVEFGGTLPVAIIENGNIEIREFKD